jgi:hypothetical protein
MMADKSQSQGYSAGTRYHPGPANRPGQRGAMELRRCTYDAEEIHLDGQAPEARRANELARELLTVRALIRELTTRLTSRTVGIVKVWVVECSVCRKPFELEAVLMPVSLPPAAIIEIGPHGIFKAPSTACPGAGRPGIGMGSKETYQRRHPGKLSD